MREYFEYLSFNDFLKHIDYLYREGYRWAGGNKLDEKTLKQFFYKIDDFILIAFTHNNRKNLRYARKKNIINDFKNAKIVLYKSKKTNIFAY